MKKKKTKKTKKNPLLIDYDEPNLDPNPYMNPYMNPNIGQRPNPLGDFGKDIDPLGGFGGGIGGGDGGILMGPKNPKFQPQLDPNKPNNIPPNARFDPWAPGPLGKKPGPNPDLPPPNGGGSGMFI